MNPVDYHPNGKTKTMIGIALALTSLLLLFAVNFIKNPFSKLDYYGHVIDVPAPAFSLMSLDGRKFQLHDFKGKYTYLMFGYLNCTTTCHSQALILNYLSNEIADKDVHFVYISMDPERDGANELADYFKSTSSRLTVLRGNSIRQMQSIANGFKAPFSLNRSVTDDEYEINHPGYVFLINPEGRLSIVYSGSLIIKDRLLEDLSHYKSHYS